MSYDKINSLKTCAKYQVTVFFRSLRKVCKYYNQQQHRLAMPHQVQIVKFCLIGVGLRGVDGNNYTIDSLLLLFYDIFHNVWVPVQN